MYFPHIKVSVANSGLVSLPPFLSTSHTQICTDAHIDILRTYVHELTHIHTLTQSMSQVQEDNRGIISGYLHSIAACTGILALLASSHHVCRLALMSDLFDIPALPSPDPWCAGYDSHRKVTCSNCALPANSCFYTGTTRHWNTALR